MKQITIRLLLCMLFILPGHTVLAVHKTDAIVIDTDWLAKHLDDPDIKIIDARQQQKYISGHIPGAANIPVMQTYNPTPPTDRVASLPLIQELFRQAGIRNDQTIVVYDDGQYIDAGRVFWVFEVFGHNNVKLLNGGFPMWQQEKRRISTNIPDIKPSDYVPGVEPERLVTKLTMRLALDDPHKQIVDARTTEEYLGKKSETKRFGHIPHAISMPVVNNFTVRNGVRMLKPLSELQAIYQPLSHDKKIYTYCNKGKESSLTYTLLRHLGYDVAHYDGSWHEWSNDETLPIEKP